MDTTTNTQHTCKNCGNTFTGKFCNVCGEKVYTAHDRSVVYIVEEAFHFLTHFEGSFLTTVKTIFLKPGKLSLDYCNGIRKKYYKPVTMFFFLIVVYLLLPGIFPKGLDMPLRNYQSQSQMGKYANGLIAKKLEKKHITGEQLAEEYAHKSHSVSKFMLFIILPFCAVVLIALYPRGRPFFDHFIFSTEINAFFLTAFFMLVPVILAIIVTVVVLIVTAVFRLATISMSGFFSEDAMMILNTVLFGIFCTVAFRRFYGSSYPVSAIKALVFVVSQYFIVFILYKFLLFTTVMWLL